MFVILTIYVLQNVIILLGLYCTFVLSQEPFVLQCSLMCLCCFHLFIRDFALKFKKYSVFTVSLLMIKELNKIQQSELNRC